MRLVRHQRGNPEMELCRSLNHRATSRLYNRTSRSTPAAPRRPRADFHRSGCTWAAALRSRRTLRATMVPYDSTTLPTCGTPGLHRLYRKSCDRNRLRGTVARAAATRARVPRRALQLPRSGCDPAACSRPGLCIYHRHRRSRFPQRGSLSLDARRPRLCRRRARMGARDDSRRSRHLGTRYPLLSKAPATGSTTPSRRSAASTRLSAWRRTLRSIRPRPSTVGWTAARCSNRRPARPTSTPSTRP